MASDLTRSERPATFDSNIERSEFCEGLVKNLVVLKDLLVLT